MASVQTVNPGKRSLSVREIQDYDSYLIDHAGFPGVILMENAAYAVALAAREMLKKHRLDRVYIFCGGGNNGGDGFAAARYLLFYGFKVEIFLFKPACQLKGDAAVNFKIIRNLGIKIRYFTDFKLPAGNSLSKKGLVIDALLGTGMRKPLKEGVLKLIGFINHISYPVLSVDIPTGLDGDTGESMGDCIKADETVTMYALKRGMTRKSAKQFTGRVTVVDVRFR